MILYKAVVTDLDIDDLGATGSKIKYVYDIIPGIDDIEADPDVELVELDYEVHIDKTPNDPRFSELWGLHNIGQTGGTSDADIDAPDAWDIQTGDSSVLITVIDTGVDYNHEDLSANIWANPGEIPSNGIDDDRNGYVDDVYGWDFYNNDNDPMDDHKHGTHCAGTIAAVGNNWIGVVGVNWAAKIMALKFLSASGSGKTSDAIKAIEYATLMKQQKGIPVIAMSNSWGGGGFSQALKNAIIAVDNAGILFVAAAGNSGSDNDVSPHYPSSYDVPNVIAVAATDHNDAMAGWSNYGATSVDLAAPSANILSTVLNNGYSLLSGTSMATPHVSGVAALIKAQAPACTHLQIKDAILRSVDPIPSLSGKMVTCGGLNDYNALQSILIASHDDFKEFSKLADDVSYAWHPIETCDQDGVYRDEFCPGEPVYVRGGPGLGYPWTMDIYAVADGGLPVAVAHATTEAPGILPITLLSDALYPGGYDIWVDLNQNGLYDDGDLWMEQALNVYAFFVVPELPMGTATTLLLTLVALALFRKCSIIRKNHKPPFSSFSMRLSRKN